MLVKGASVVVGNMTSNIPVKNKRWSICMKMVSSSQISTNFRMLDLHVLRQITQSPDLKIFLKTLQVFQLLYCSLIKAHDTG